MEAERYSLCEWTYEGELRMQKRDLFCRLGETRSARYSGEHMTVCDICAYLGGTQGFGLVPSGIRLFVISGVKI